MPHDEHAPATPITATIDTGIRFLVSETTSTFRRKLKALATHANPEYHKRRARGNAAYGVDPSIRTYRESEVDLVLPRGLTKAVHALAAENGVTLRFVDKRIVRPEVEWPALKPGARDYQVASRKAAHRRQQGVVRMPTGCITGDAMIGVNRGGKSFEIRLADLVHRQNGGRPDGDRRWDLSIPTTIRGRDDEGFVRLLRLVDAYESGVKRTYTVTFDSGHSVRATYEHRFLTDQGWKRLAELCTGTAVYVEAKDGWRAVETKTVLARITSIESFGEEMTYDLSLEAPHNFLANGIVVHNSGKTFAALEFAAETKQPTLVIMRDRQLLAQWKERAVSQLGLSKNEIGELRGGVKPRIGPRLTLALQQTLNSERFPLAEVAQEFGCVIVDECHGCAAETYEETICEFGARYRVGYSADETRKDRKEFLIYDHFGEVIHEVFREDLEREGVIHRVEVRMIPTDFRADWYVEAGPGERDFNRLLAEMTEDAHRNEQLLDLVKAIVDRGESPAFVFSHRVEHARWLADVGVFSRKITSGLMLGGAPNAVRFAEDKERLSRGALQVACGTFAAIGQGIDVPNVVAGVMSTPIGNNRQFFNQIRGRVCRAYPGKTYAHLYVLWDRHVFPDAPKTFATWNGGNVRVWDSDNDTWRDPSSRRR